MKVINAKRLLLGFLFCLSIGQYKFAQAGTAFDIGKCKDRQQILLEVRVNKAIPLDSICIDFSPVDAIGLSRKWIRKKQKLNGGYARLKYEGNGHVYLLMPSFKGEPFWWIAEAGNSVVLEFDGRELKFIGTDADQFILQQRLQTLKKEFQTPTKEPLLIHPISFSQYFEWMKWLDEYAMRFTAIVESYRGRVSNSVLNRISDQFANEIPSKLKDIFSSLYRLAESNKFERITIDDLCTIYDSTVTTRINKWLPFKTDGYLGSWTILKTHVARRYNFAFDEMPLKSELYRALLYYQEGLRWYKDKPLTKELFLARLLTEEMIKDIGYTPEIKEVLDKYYSDSTYPEYKAYVKDYEAKSYRIRSGFKAPTFTLTNTKGTRYTSDQLKGKIVLMDFWFTGCTGCVGMTPVLRKIENHFKGDSNIVFLSVSADKDSSIWIRSIQEKKYTTGGGVNLYTNGKGMDDYISSAFMVSSFPSIYLLDHEYRIVENPLPDPRKDGGAYLIELIERKRALLNDGPYIIRTGDSLKYISFNSSSLKIEKSGFFEKTNLQVQTDGSKTFFVALRPFYETEPSVFAKPSKLLVFSDIEGNFTALRKLLQENKVVDDDFNWCFGDGHLVFAGDMFDRGEQVTECLWLLYSLEEKAKAAGGYVHFILGNHEIMNLSGSHTYARIKYGRNAEALGMSISKLYDSNSELGKWLRTKNVIEKIGDLLFLHGGISPELNELSLSIEQINSLARPYYDRDNLARNSNNKSLATIYDSKFSPFWYRLYYLETERKVSIGKRGYDTLYKTQSIEIDRILTSFRASKIITGHTIVADTVSIHYGGKVINTDTRHAIGKSEALLVQGEKFYRVDDKGQRWVLLDEND